MRAWLVLAMSGLMLAACSDSPPPTKTVFDGQTDALKKARAAETKIQESADRLRQTVDTATNPPAPSD